MTPFLTERYRDRLRGVLSCYDRIMITGTLPGACFAEGMTKILRASGIRIFDYPEFAATLRDRVREAATALTAAAGECPDLCVSRAALHRFEPSAR